MSELPGGLWSGFFPFETKNPSDFIKEQISKGVNTKSRLGFVFLGLCFVLSPVHSRDRQPEKTVLVTRIR